MPTGGSKALHLWARSIHHPAQPLAATPSSLDCLYWLMANSLSLPSQWCGCCQGLSPLNVHTLVLASHTNQVDMCACMLSCSVCPTLCDPIDCSPPDFSVHRIFQAGVLDQVPFPSPGDLPDPGIEPVSPALEADALTSEPPGKLTRVRPSFPQSQSLPSGSFHKPFILIYQRPERMKTTFTEN